MLMFFVFFELSLYLTFLSSGKTLKRTWLDDHIAALSSYIPHIVSVVLPNLGISVIFWLEKWGSGYQVFVKVIMVQSQIWLYIAYTCAVPMMEMFL